MKDASAAGLSSPASDGGGVARAPLLATPATQPAPPPGLPDVPGLVSAARHVPARHVGRTGSAWCDVLPRPGRAPAVVTGAVPGSDLPAARAAGGVRQAIRAYAMQGHGPARVLELANRFLTAAGTGRPVACCYLELDIGGRLATGACAGHPDPLLLRPGHLRRPLGLHPGPPLGVAPSTALQESVVGLDPGQVLVLCTERLRETPPDGLPESVLALTASPSPDADAARAALAELLRVLVGPCPERAADVALVGVMLAPQPHAPARVRRPLAAEARSAGLARRFLAEVLAAWQLPAVLDTALLVVSELVTNAVAHTVGPVELTLVREPDTLLIEVSDSSEHGPTSAEPAPEATSGRGMLLVSAVAREWGVRALPAGKTVWARLCLPEASDLDLAAPVRRPRAQAEPAPAGNR